MRIFKLSIIFLLGSLLAVLSAMAQDPLIAPSQGQYQQSELLVSKTVPVIVDGKELFQVAGITSASNVDFSMRWEAQPDFTSILDSC